MTSKGTTIETNERGLAIERTYAATPERLFEAWTDRALLARWFGPGPMMKCAVPHLDARKGGRFRIEMSGPGPDGKTMELAYEGSFEEVVPARRLAMIWDPVTMPGSDAPEPATRVTVTFTPVEGGTRLRLTHEGLPGLPWAKQAANGWAAALDTLAKSI